MARLSFQHFQNDERPDLIILHGLLGSSRNWGLIGKQLANYFNVFALDLRNHGNSPHCESMSYGEMSSDLYEFMQDHGIQNATVLGHSMGGKVAMRFAMENTGWIDSLIVLDIAPKKYEHHYYELLQEMQHIHLDSFTDRKSLESTFEKIVPDWAFRQFLMTNIKRDSNKKFQWVINLPVIIESLPHISGMPFEEGSEYEGESVFIKGTRSDFITESDINCIQKYFKNAEIQNVEAGHNVHIDNKDDLISLLVRS
jgi:pimeloyl-ACP methyl ester carboxylesterase